MKKSSITIMPEYFRTYIAHVPDGELLPLLETEGILPYRQHQQQLENLGTRVYAFGKWTVPQIIEHVTDAERIFQYRALRFAHQDKTELAGFDENLYAAVSKAGDRSVASLLEELEAVRRSTYLLFRQLDNDQLGFTGTANGKEVSVAALGFVMIGHALHHFNVIRDRYFPLSAE